MTRNERREVLGKLAKLEAELPEGTEDKTQGKDSQEETYPTDYIVEPDATKNGDVGLGIPIPGGKSESTVDSVSKSEHPPNNAQSI